MNANEIETLKRHAAQLKMINASLREQDATFQLVADDEIVTLRTQMSALEFVNANLQRVADAKPAELNQEMMDEVHALRERVAKLDGWLNNHESMLARSRLETNDMRRERDQAITRRDSFRALALGNAEDAKFWKGEAEVTRAREVELFAALRRMAQDVLDVMNRPG